MSKGMSLFVVNGHTEEELNFEIGEADTAQRIAQEAEKAWGLVSGRYEIVFEGTVVDSKEVLSKLGITEDAKVTVQKRSDINVNGIEELKERREELTKLLRDCSTLTLLLVVYPDDRGVLSLPSTVLPPGLRHLKIIDPMQQVLSLADCFLDFAQLDTIDLTTLTAVTRIGCNFLMGCNDITSLDLRSMHNLRQIGDSFLCACVSLQSLCTPSATVGTIGIDFLFDCSGIWEVDLTFLNGLQKVPSGFLSYCSSLISIDLTPLSCLREIGGDFMQGCRGLHEVSFASSPGLISVGSCFFSSCSSMTCLDMQGLSALSDVGHSCLEMCSVLYDLRLPPHLTTSSLGPLSLKGCDLLLSKKRRLV
eukprot:TRINITY_DN8110_c0_g1_i1.p1 TRINITY_DN8110_c0_g1~~TRINITY_DN8110_c0_g1_i1.p1  ORF type:complete len:363 (+),score=47.05 TRINITY_DN8110_c0_g1_i1:92-1180(+)